MSTFHELGISLKWIERLKALYITHPTDIQAKVILPLLRGRDVIGKAQTGTGKTLAFVLPALETTQNELPHVQTLILSPTRELALQSASVIRELAGDHVPVCAVYGGADYEKQAKALQQGAQIAVGTPGRILEHLREGTINLKYLKHLVIDEGDQMMAMGFLEDIELITTKLPAKLQISLFSATIPDHIKKLARKIMNNALTVEAANPTAVLEQISQVLVHTRPQRKQDTLKTLLQAVDPFMAVIFCNTKKNAEELYAYLGREGLEVELLHGEYSQAKRETILKKFRALKFPYLVTTDLSARGLDISGITHIFNYELPAQTEYYIHRVGRTGRMHKEGMAISLVTEEDQKRLERIEKAIGQKIPSFYDRSEEERRRLDLERLRQGEPPSKRKPRYRTAPPKSKEKGIFTKNRAWQGKPLGKEGKATSKSSRKNVDAPNSADGLRKPLSKEFSPENGKAKKPSRTKRVPSAPTGSKAPFYAPKTSNAKRLASTSSKNKRKR